MAEGVLARGIGDRALGRRRRVAPKLIGLAALGVFASLAVAADWGLDLASPFRTSSPIALPVPLAAPADLVPVPAPTPGATLAPEAGVVGQRVEVTGFGSNPGTLTMYKYVPVGLPRDAPLVVVMHGCNSSAAAMDDEPGWIEMANAYKFALVFPETNTVNEPNYGCFRSWDANHNRRGVGESLSIRQMVEWMRKNHGTSRTRTFATGFSSGGINTSVLLAAYPDVFAAGAVMSGHPYRCASTYDEYVGCNLFSRSQTARQWGDLVRAAYPGYTGPLPRVSIWHGTADVIVNTYNAPEVVKQWTNVHGIDAAPDRSELVLGHQHYVYADSAGTPKVELYLLTGLSHQIAINPLGPFAPRCGVQDGFSQATTICAVHYVAKWFGIAP